MPTPRDVHRGATRVLSAVILVVGVALVISTLARGGGPLAIGVVMGVLFAAVGAGGSTAHARSRVMRTRTDGAREAARRSLGSPALFAILYTSVASAIYFSLGVVGERALGLTPVVFLSAGCSSAWPR
jgi:hypothetical protein